MDFALDAPGYPSAIDALSAILTECTEFLFFLVQTDYGACSLRRFEIEVPPGTQPIQSRPYRLNPALSKQAYTILDFHLDAGLIQPSTCSW